jgi:hypothetical protein
VDGVPFGWNLGYGFGDTSAATENVLVYDGRVHKLAAVTFYIPGNASGHPRFTEPWRFYSSDNRFEADFRPVLDRQSCTDFKALKSDQHQVFGFFTGRAVLDDGQIVPFRSCPALRRRCTTNGERHALLRPAVPDALYLPLGLMRSSIPKTSRSTATRWRSTPTPWG